MTAWTERNKDRMKWKKAVRCLGFYNRKQADRATQLETCSAPQEYGRIPQTPRMELQTQRSERQTQRKGQWDLHGLRDRG